MGIMLDLSVRHFVHPVGELCAIGTWMIDDGSYLAVMLLLRAGTEISDNTDTCYIPQCKAWMWSETIGDEMATDFAIDHFLVGLHMDLTKANRHKIRSIVSDRIDDLMNMPPVPPGYKPVFNPIGEMTVINKKTGKTKEVYL